MAKKTSKSKTEKLASHLLSIEDQISKTKYERFYFNNGTDIGQVIDHLHKQGATDEQIRKATIGFDSGDYAYEFHIDTWLNTTEKEQDIQRQALIQQEERLIEAKKQKDKERKERAKAIRERNKRLKEIKSKLTEAEWKLVNGESDEDE